MKINKNSDFFNAVQAPFRCPQQKAGTVSRGRRNREYHATIRDGYNVSPALICGFQPDLKSRQSSRHRQEPTNPTFPPRRINTSNWGRFRAPGVTCGPNYWIDQIFEDPQVQQLGIAKDVPNAENRHIRLVGQPVTLSRTPSKMEARPPEFGEQTDEVYGVRIYCGRDRHAEAGQGRVRA